MICSFLLRLPVCILLPLLWSDKVQGQCTNGDVCLVGGSGLHEGRVEVCVNGVWGTVCDDSWSNNDAVVVCKQLGYTTSGATALSNAYFGAGSGSIFMDDVVCSGFEARLTSCSHISNHNCGHSEDASVRCPLTRQAQRTGVCSRSFSCTEYQSVIRTVSTSEGYGCGFLWLDTCYRITYKTITVQQSQTVYRTVPVCCSGYTGDGQTCTPVCSGCVNGRCTSPGVCACFVGWTGTRCETAMCNPGCVRGRCTRPNYCLCFSGWGGDACDTQTCPGREGAVRLAGGTRLSGRVELCSSGVWGTVCDDLWDDFDASVACYQLGFSRNNARGSTFGSPGTGPILMDDVYCIGTESRLSECQHTTRHNCGHHEDAGVTCYTRVCTDGAVQLVSSEGVVSGSVARGRVEVCTNETWGTVCDQSWSKQDAEVVCAQLGYLKSGARSHSDALFGQGTESVLFNNVVCTGLETSLLDCTLDPVGVIGSCTHADDAGVSCRIGSCTNGDLTLVDGLSENEGRLEICHSNQWGTVCDDLWTSSATAVACRQLGVRDSTHVSRVANNAFGTAPSSVSILLDDVVCTGSEETLLRCSHLPVGQDNCGHHKDISIRCGVCEEGNVRLVDGNTHSEGRVEVCIGGRWGTVCDDGWSPFDALVVCRQLGYPAAGARALRGTSFTPNFTLPIVMDNVACDSTEEKLTDCIHRNASRIRACSHKEDARIRCSVGRPGTPQDVEAVTVSSTSVTLSWSSPVQSDPPSAAITGYSVTCSAAGQPSRSAQAAATATSATIESLHPFTSYSCCVAADSSAGMGPSSCQQSQTNETISGPPESVAGVAVSSRSILISWLPPSMPNGRIREYRIAVTEENTDTETQLISTSLSRLITGLHPFYIYSIKVTAVTVAEGPYASPIEIKTFSDVPSAPPAMLTSSDITSTSFRVAWHQPEQEHRNGNITHYRLRLNKQDSSTYSYVNVEPLYVVRSLSPFTQYTWSVAAATINGTGPYSSNTSIETQQDAPSAAPKSVNHTVPSPTSLRIMWSPPSREHQNGNITSYHLELNDTAGVRTVTGTSYVANNLHPNYIYGYRVAAVTIARGPYSEWTHVRMPTTVPGPPRNVVVRQRGLMYITLVWQPPLLDQQNGIITSYSVFITSQGGSAYTLVTTGLSLVVSSLLPNTDHSFAVAAINDAGIGRYSSPSLHATTLPPPETSPPRNVTLLVLDHERILVTWTDPPVSERSGVINGYCVRVTEVGSGRTWEESSTLPRLMLSNLRAFTMYQVQVKVVPGVGSGEYSGVVSNTTGIIRPGGSPVITNTSSTSRSVFLWWNPPPENQQHGTITGYVIDYLEDGVPMSVSVAAHVQQYTIVATPHTEYVIGIAALNSAGRGPLSGIVELHTQEEAPSHSPLGLMGEPLSSTAISLTWDPPPEDHHHGEIDSYTVLCTLYNVDDTLTEHTTATENITITGLLPFRTYSCNVSAFTVGHGPFSGTIPTTTLEDVPSGAPTGLEARNDGESLVFLSWSEPDPALHNGIIRHYLITLFIAASPSTRSSYQTPTSETNVTVPGLHPYTHYRISVAAVTIDPGPNSGYVDITTEEAPPSEAPDSLSVTQISPQSLFISWEPPPVEHRNGVIRHYIIRLVEKETGIRRLINTLNNGTDFSVGGLHPFYHYNVSVAAVTVDQGPFSLASCVQMPETESSSPPRDLTGRALNSTSIQLEWEPPALEDQNGHITSYTVLCFAVSQTLIMQSTSDNVITLSGLHPYTMYSCNVSAVTVAEGPFSDSVNVTTVEDASSREPTNLQVQDFGSRYMTLSWSEPPVEHHNGRIRHYLIHVVPMHSWLQSSIHITTSSQLLYTVLGLHPYSNYTISVAAFTVASGPNATVVHVTEEEAPSSPPLGLSVDVLSPYSLMVSWSQPPIEERNGEIVHYTVTVETGANVTHWDTRDLEMILELLHPNYEYHISVAATTVAQGPYSPELSITMPEAPPSMAPTISVGDVTSRSIRLQWIPPAFEHQNGIITGYVLEYWSERDGNVSVAVDRVWHVLSADPYTRYWVRVAAENSAGQGPFTEIVTVKTLPDVPSRAPTSLTVVNITSTSLELQWDPPPPLFHNGLIGSYIVRCSEVETSGTIIRNSSTSQIVVSGLHPYYTYNCSVSAVTVGPGPFSHTIRSRTLEDAPSGRPYNLIATKVTPVSLTITWTDPEPSQWNGVIQYYVLYITRVELTRNTSVYTATSLPTSFTGLHPYTAYEVTVAAFTIAHGPNSTTELFRTAEDVPVAPPQNVTAHPISSTELSVTWRPPPQDKQNGKIRHYNISVYQAATDEERWYRTPDSTAHWIVPSLHPYQVYHIRVAAVTIGTSPFSEQVEVRMLEEAPSSPPINLTVVEKGSTYILLEWQAPLKKSQNGVIRHYLVALTEENSTQTLRNLTTVSSQPSINIGSLQAGKTYSCVVSAVTVSPGPLSEPISFTTETNVPGTVRSLLAVAISSRSMNISWQPPEYSESSKEIIEYQVTVTHFGVVGEDEHLATTASKSAVVGSLHPNYVYQCSVTFRTSEGLGPVAHVLLKLPPDLPTSSPQNVTAVPADATTLHIYWSPPPLMEQNGDIMQYGLNMIDVELEESMQYYLSGSRTSYVVYNLHPHAVYQYTMTAFTAVGNGPYSQAKSIQMLPAAPSAAPFNLSLVEVGSSYALLQWSAPPPRERNGIIQLYQVHWNSSRGETLIINTAGPGTHLLLNSLQSNTRYTCRVAAVTVSAGPLSSAIQFTTNVSAPDTVQSLRGIVLSPQAVNISWLPPLGGKTYLDYQVTITPLYRNGESHQRITSSTGVVVTGLQPGAFYLCVVAARTSAGLQHSVNIVLVEMPPDVPSGFPRGVSHVPFNSRTLRIFWSPPLQEEQNGAIVKYSIKITEVESGEHREYITRDSTTTFVIPNLHPHYHYNYTVAAHTSVGNGPHSPATHLQMPQDAPDAPPLNLTAANSGPQSVNLQWLPPAFDNRNGDITGYIVKIFGIAEREIDNVTSHTVGGLNASTTYSFSVAARTLVGLGPFSQPAYVQTLHGESPAPEGVSAHRISATQIRVTWPLAEKDRAHSPILSYTVKYYPLRSDSRSRRETDVKLIDAKTNITISGLVPILAYGVAVAANTAYGTGTFSDLVTVGLSENSHFQLFFNGAIDCQEWIRYHTDAKLQSMKESLAPELETTCQCLFSTDYMRLNQLQCISAHTDWLIVWGRIVGTNHTDSNGIRDVLQTWSNMESKVVVEGVHLTTLKFCSVSLEAGEPPYCEVPPASGGFPSDTSDPQPSTITYGIVGVVVTMLTMIFVVLVCIVTVTFYKRKKVRDRQLGFHSTHPLNNFNTSTPSNAVAAKCKGVGDSDSNIYDQADSIYETILDSDSPYSQVPSQPPPLPDPNISNKLACEEPVKTAACSGSDSEGYSKTQFFPVKDLSKRCPSPVDYSIVNPKAPVPGCETEYATVDETTRGACLVESGDDYVPMYDDSVSATPKSTYQKLVLDSRDEGSGEYQVPRSVNGDQTSKDAGKGHPEYANFVPAMKSDT